MIGDVGYIFTLKLPEVLAVKQSLQEDRFVKIIEENKVPGGKGEQYMTYKAQSLTNPDKVFEYNNYLSPFGFISIPDLLALLKSLNTIILPDNYKKIFDTMAKLNLIKLKSDDDNKSIKDNDDSTKDEDNKKIINDKKKSI